jgi:hypothetical protein
MLSLALPAPWLAAIQMRPEIAMLLVFGDVQAKRPRKRRTAGETVREKTLVRP